MSVRSAEIEIIWLLQASAGEACGLRASAWSHSEETEGGTGGGSRSYRPRDYHPDYAAGARSRMRRAWVALTSLHLDDQLTLRRRFGPRGPHEAIARGFGEWSPVAEYLPAVQRKAKTAKVTAIEVLREQAQKPAGAALLDESKALVRVALERYSEQLEAFDKASEDQRMRERERWQAIRDGRAA